MKMTGLKEAMSLLKSKEALGGVQEIGKVKTFFRRTHGVSQQVVLRCREDENITVHNIFFPQKGNTLVSGEIANKLIQDYPEYFEVIACTGLIENGKELPFVFVKQDDKTGDFYGKRVNGKLKEYDSIKELKLKTTLEISNEKTDFEMKQRVSKLKEEKKLELLAKKELEAELNSK